jgi:hypothetical protein
VDQASTPVLEPRILGFIRILGTAAALIFDRWSELLKAAAAFFRKPLAALIALKCRISWFYSHVPHCCPEWITGNQKLPAAMY